MHVENPSGKTAGAKMKHNRRIVGKEVMKWADQIDAALLDSVAVSIDLQTVRKLDPETGNKLETINEALKELVEDLYELAGKLRPDCV